MSTITPTLHDDWQIELLTGQTGVRVSGLDLASVTDAEVEDIRRLVAGYCVAVFPGQDLAPKDQVAFCGRLGPIVSTPGIDRHPDWPDVYVIHNEGKAKRPVTVFHTDTSFIDRPPSFTALSAVELPPSGGDTIFTNQYLAFEELSGTMQAFVSGLRIRHVPWGVVRPDEVPAESVWHPAVRVHPVTGRPSLYVSTPLRCAEVEGLTKAESELLIGFLFEHSLSVDRMYRHRWHPGDFVMWDNRCSLHGGVHDHGDAPRTLHRVMVEGEASVGMDAGTDGPR